MLIISLLALKLAYLEGSINCLQKVDLCSSINLTQIEQILRLIHTQISLRFLLTVMQYRLFGFQNFDENTFGLFAKHRLGKVGILESGDVQLVLKAYVRRATAVKKQSLIRK